MSRLTASRFFYGGGGDGRNRRNRRNGRGWEGMGEFMRGWIIQAAIAAARSGGEDE
jgi:hypothetical protein